MLKIRIQFVDVNEKDGVEDTLARSESFDVEDAIKEIFSMERYVKKELRKLNCDVSSCKDRAVISTDDEWQYCEKHALEAEAKAQKTSD